MKFNKYIFIDSKSIGSVEQFLFVFQNNLIDPSEVKVLVKFRWKTFIRHIFFAKKYGYILRFYLKINENILVPTKNQGVVFYFFNSLTNINLIKNRNFKHIFFGHGESHKRASLHPLYRVYDLILVSGTFAKDRLIERGVISQACAESNVVDIGFDGVANIDFLNFNIYSKNKNYDLSKTFLYMPTWEGGVDEENYSSLSSNNISRILIATLKLLDIKTLIIYPHPNIGFRVRAYKFFVNQLVSNLLEEGFSVAIYKKRLDFTHKKNKIFLVDQNISIDCKNIFYGFSDISAGESMAAKKNIPSFILIANNNEFYAPSSYMSFKKKFIIDIRKIDDLSVINIVSVMKYEKQKEYMENFKKNEFDLSKIFLNNI